MRIFQRGFNFSQDGPGNRLVYHLQGCNLRCPWCSNPEGLALSGGASVSVEELLDEAQRSSLLFFDGGGVTLTGGEATLQPDEVLDFLTRLRARGISTCIETNGISSRLPELFPVLDLLILDVKHHDPELHRKITGLSNEGTFANLEKALDFGVPLALRIPLIGGFNASEEDAECFAAQFCRLGVPGKATVELLPYHAFGKSKYEELGLPYPMTESAHVAGETVARFSEILSQAGIQIIHT